MSNSEVEESKLTPARIDLGRAGTRPRTGDWLRFRSDHARARDAVGSELSPAFLDRMKAEFSCQFITSNCVDRDDFVRFPPKGKQPRELDIASVLSSCVNSADVQIVISDGLSARAVEANVPDLLPILLDGLKLEGFSCGTPIIASLARVAIADPVAYRLKSRLVINLIGERPGLSCAESLSAYITLNPGPHTISSDRTVVSNIHKGGTPPLEAGAYVVQLVKRIFKHNLSGVKLQQADS